MQYLELYLKILKFLLRNLIDILNLLLGLSAIGLTLIFMICEIIVGEYNGVGYALLIIIYVCFMISQLSIWKNWKELFK